jgi:hypothetical protein
MPPSTSSRNGPTIAAMSASFSLRWPTCLDTAYLSASHVTCCSKAI